MRYLKVVLILFAASSVCLAQPEFPQGEFQVFYQRVQGFDFRSGSPLFDVQGADFNGGGFGFTFNINHWFGVFSQTGFYGGVEQSGLKMKLINEMQGVKVTRRGSGNNLNVYAKAGMGFVRYVFDVAEGTAVRYGTSFSYGGGLEAKLRDGMAFLVDASQISMSLPDLTGAPDRDKWDGNVVLTGGILFTF